MDPGGEQVTWHRREAGQHGFDEGLAAGTMPRGGAVHAV
jgi:hypothetical protein